MLTITILLTERSARNWNMVTQNHYSSSSTTGGETQTLSNILMVVIAIQPRTLPSTLLNLLLNVFTEDDGKCTVPTSKTVKQQSNIKIESKGVLKQLQELDATKGAGPNGISPALLKYPACFIYDPLTKLYQYSFDTSTVP